MDKAKELLEKYKNGTLTEEEKVILESWYIHFAKNEPSLSSLEELETHLNELDAPEVYVYDLPAERKRPLLKWFSAAAILVLIVGATLLFNRKEDAVVKTTVLENDALPGEYKAILTLSDGQKISLEESELGELTTDKEVSIFKTQEGEIAYKLNSGTFLPVGKARLHTLQTPKAGQYKINLPDGSVAWLNAASMIQYPEFFNEKERLVRVKGEVYFDVKRLPNGSLPFKVISDEQVIEVLGTQFNVNSYADEEVIKTTLLTGSIKVNSTKELLKTLVLKPGQQAVLSKNVRDKAITITELADIGSAVAWKNGYFKFNNVGLKELMRQLSRWYDMEVIYETPNVRDFEFVGEINRNMNLSKVLKILETGGINFRIEGKKIIVN